MLDASGKVIYVGKAKNLKNRVSSYFAGNLATRKDAKTAHMVGQIADIQITITNSEVEALLLEYQLIQQLKPRYNILFRDDKSYPYIMLTADDFPQLTFYRGSTSGPGEFFGPYPSTTAVRESIDLLQRAFKLRNCDKTYFSGRTRPCLQYQIKRCTAPCVGYISREDYAQDVNSARWLLQGKTNEVIERLVLKMDAAANEHDYEQAARIRDQIVALRAMQKQQIISDPNANQNLDVVAIASLGAQSCIHLLNIRSGRMLGSKQYFINSELSVSHDDAAVLETFVMQHYALTSTVAMDNNLIPQEIVLEKTLENMDLITDALKQQHHRTIKLSIASRGVRNEWMQMAKESALQALRLRLAVDVALEQQLHALGTLLGLNGSLRRIECFDVSHMQGEGTIASCVVFTNLGPEKKSYRRFKIKTAKGGDDYAAMEEALQRHYVRVQESGAPVPDLLLIDGGKGQLSRAMKVCKELALNGVIILGIAKGPSRKPGLEKLFLAPDARELDLAADSPALHLLQRVRDEAHRFAITGHRKQRGKSRMHSVLETIPGVGSKRRAELLRYFGGLQEVRCASVEELAKVPGISKVLATSIYALLHDKEV